MLKEHDHRRFCKSLYAENSLFTQSLDSHNDRLRVIVYLVILS